MFKNSSNLCSHMEVNTQNPNPIFKITILYKIDQKCQNTFEMLENIKTRKPKKTKNTNVFYYLFKMHNSYFVIVVNVVIVVYFVYFISRPQL